MSVSMVVTGCRLRTGLTSNAVHGSWHGNCDVEVLGLSLREAIGARDVVGHGKILGEGSGVAWTWSITILPQV